MARCSARLRWSIRWCPRSALLMLPKRHGTAILEPFLAANRSESTFLGVQVWRDLVDDACDRNPWSHAMRISILGLWRIECADSGYGEVSDFRKKSLQSREHGPLFPV